MIVENTADIAGDHVPKIVIDLETEIEVVIDGIDPVKKIKSQKGKCLVF